MEALSRQTPTRSRLIDCGAGRRLEQLGPHLIDRPAPVVDRVAPGLPDAWREADARYDRVGGAGSWHAAGPLPDPWQVTIEGLTLELRLTDTGQVGVFLEQVPVWRWILRRVRDATGPLQILNLFAHTGAATLAAAAAGARVAHVDASRSAVSWARRNAELSGLSGASIRWIVEDAEAFVARELRRGNRYDAVVLDPPSYGHGPNRQRWILEDRLPDLLRACAALTAGRRAFLLVTTHTPAYGPERLGRELAGAMAPDELSRGRLETGTLDLEASSGRRLPLGAFARWNAR